MATRAEPCQEIHVRLKDAEGNEGPRVIFNPGQPKNGKGEHIKTCVMFLGTTCDCDPLSKHPYLVEDAIEPVLQNCPNLETFHCTVPSAMVSAGRFLRVLQQALFPFLSGEGVKIKLQNDTITVKLNDKKITLDMTYREDGDNRVVPRGVMREMLWNPLVQKLLEHFQNSSADIKFLHSRPWILAETFQALCNNPCGKLAFQGQVLDDFAMATLIGSLKGNRSNRKRKRQKQQRLSNSLKVLSLKDTSMTFPSFLLLCEMMEENQSIVSLGLESLSFYHTPPSIATEMDPVSPLLDILARNRTLRNLTAAFVEYGGNQPHQDESAAIRQRQTGQLVRLYDIVKNGNDIVCCLAINESGIDIKREENREAIAKIDERLSLNAFHLTRIMDHDQYPCTAEVMAEALVIAAEKRVQKECWYEAAQINVDLNESILLNSYFRVFQTHPDLVALIPVQE